MQTVLFQTIQFSISTVLIVKIFLFQAKQFFSHSSNSAKYK